jgi:hypothetical protein
MTTITDFYKQNDEAFALISKIRLPEDFNPKKEYYFDDLVMSNILSFIPKYPKKAKRYDTFRCGVFEEINSYDEYKERKSDTIIIILKRTPKMVDFIRVTRWYIDIPSTKKKIYIVGGRELFKSNSVCRHSAFGLIPVRQENMNKIMDRSWFASINTDIDECIHYIRNPHQNYIRNPHQN